MEEVRSSQVTTGSQASAKNQKPSNSRTGVGPVNLILADRALTSLRASGHDFRSAVGEVFDNSLQANANNVRLRLFTEKRIVGKNQKKTDVVDRLAVGDDGDGMTADVLHRSLQLGYSTRYDDRTGMGRFGVGAKLGGISQARRIDIFSCARGASEWMHTYIDLDEIHSGAMTYIPEPAPAKVPTDCADLVNSQHGTLVVWSKTDRLAERDSGGARQASTVETELINYTGWTFRKFLDGGIQIYINDTRVRPHDPLYLMKTTRFHEGAEADPIAGVLVSEGFDWEVPDHPQLTGRVAVTVTLLPQEFRPKKGAGGSKQARERRIDENEGVSILRADREIFFGYLKDVQPPVEDLDRFIGIEIRFTPELDECFKVRNVKKGAEPIDGLRDKLRELIWKTVLTARKQIRTHWETQEAEKQRESGVHTEAEEIAAKTKDSSPKPRAGQDMPEEEREEKIHEAAKSLTKEHPEKLAEVEAEIRKRPLTIVPETWPGNEFVEIEHLGSTAIVKLNMRHPFYGEVYAKLLSEVERAQVDGTSEVSAIARLAQVGLDLLILSYARAEGMREDANEYYSDLRTHWSVHLKNMIQEWKRL